MSRLGLRVTRGSCHPFDRVAEALVESEIGAARRRRPGDVLPPRRGPPLEIGIGEEAFDWNRPEPLRRVEDENRNVPREERRE